MDTCFYMYMCTFHVQHMKKSFEIFQIKNIVVNNEITLSFVFKNSFICTSFHLVNSIQNNRTSFVTFRCFNSLPKQGQALLHNCFDLVMHCSQFKSVRAFFLTKKSLKNKSGRNFYDTLYKSFYCSKVILLKCV